jgi:hypothetical protein
MSNWRQRSVWATDTVMGQAFIDALLHWAATNHMNEDALVMLPTGLANAAEVLKVLRALKFGSPRLPGLTGVA